MRRGIITFLAFLFLMPLFASTGEAQNKYIKPIYKICGISVDCGYCHVDPKGAGALTPFGDMFVAGGYDPCVFCPDDADCVDSCDPSETSCTDGVDNDCDGNVDCADTDCTLDPACCTASETQCTDSIDNDCDGQLDCADTDCTNDPACESGCTANEQGLCSDGLDNDCDNLSDCSDPDCGPDPVCEGGGCVPDETPEATCNDGKDNDCDGLADCTDSDCAAACSGPEDCKDGADNDGDGRIDCADSDCTGTPECTSSVSSHLTINQYNGPATCIGCHSSAGTEMVNSVHGTWRGATPDVPNITGETGKWGQSNNYCTDAEMADFACLKCHAALVSPPTNLTPTDMDCLQCHQNTYQATFLPGDPVTYTNCVDGGTMTYQFPTPEADGKVHKYPRFDLMPTGTTMIELARTVHRPDNASCLLPCHASAGGGDGTKRGDLGSDMVNPPVTQDVHLSSAGNARLVCGSCHVATNHQIPGRGNDLRPTDTGATMKQCVDCHTGMGSGTGHTVASTSNAPAADRHVARVACTSCHIDVYAKGVGTEVSRDWRSPHWNPGGCEGQGAWVGHEVRATNLVPEYRFWNGQSWVYDRNGNDGLALDPIDNMLTFSYPLGDVNDGKLHPFKVHTSWNPVEDATNITNFDVLQMFTTGCYDDAARAGLDFIGATGSYTWKENKAYHLITHGVAPATTANDCAKCHSGTIDLAVDSKLDKLGYKAKANLATLCVLCHSSKTETDFYRLHDRHVLSKEYDCSWCHSFTRPERNLTMP